jgi:hypothetical protein
MPSKKAQSSDSTPRPASEGYKVYLRVPANAESVSTAMVKDFIAKFAELLTDEDKNITVETYTGTDGALELVTRDKQSGQRVESGKLADAKVYRHADGGSDSVLIPLYVCHNKY